MTKTSSVVTGGATFAAAGIAPLVEWLANSKFNLAMPPQVVLIVAAALVTVGHFLTNVINAKGLAGKLAPAAPETPTVTATAPQAGFARISSLFGMAVMSLAFLALSGCSLMSPTIDKIEEGAMQTVVQSTERTICRDLPIGAWMAYYGTNADRVKGWQALCFNPIKAPLNDQTVAAILKVYPGFQQAVEAGGPLAVTPPQAAQPAAPQVAGPAPTADPMASSQPIAAAIRPVVKPAPPRRIVRVPPAPIPVAAPSPPAPAQPPAAPLPPKPAAVVKPTETTLLSAPVVKP